MIAFLMTGGIGDAIVNQPVPEKLREMFDEEVFLFYFDKPVKQVISHNFDSVCGSDLALEWQKHKREKLYDQARSKGCTLAISNTYIEDSEGGFSFMRALEPSRLDVERRYRQLLLNNLAKDIGIPLKSLVGTYRYHILQFLASETSYYAGFNRSGIDVGYDDIRLDIPQYAIDFADQWTKHRPRYIIVQDSRLGGFRAMMKSWYLERWDALCARLAAKYEVPIVQLGDVGKPKFEHCIHSSEVFGAELDFYKVLAVLSKSMLYVGTSSWPSLAAIVCRDPKYVVLQGAVAKGWSCDNLHTIRRGDCQACESVTSYLDLCPFNDKPKECMRLITVDDVMEAVEEELQ